ncbi:flagellar C1a complex subunit C1a-32-domain-containing protein [Cladochytrium replicatum]|nr:flagellar C1a complex subunit C1a-32-domain-containing protein [Cladochytrium replicatum]
MPTPPATARNRPGSTSGLSGPASGAGATKNPAKSSDPKTKPDPAASKKGKKDDAPQAQLPSADEKTLLTNPDASPLTWSVLTPSQLADIEGSTVELGLAKLGSCMGLSAWKEDLQSNAALSFHYSNVQFSKENNFTPEQTAALLSIMKFTVDKSIEKGLTMSESLSMFKQLLLSHNRSPSTRCTGGSVAESGGPTWDLFGTPETKAVMKLAMSTIFQHYRLYQAVFSTEQEKEVIKCTVSIEKPFVAGSFFPDKPRLSKSAQSAAEVSWRVSTTVRSVAMSAARLNSSESLWKTNSIEIPNVDGEPFLPPLSEAITMEQFEAEVARLKEKEEKERLERERREEERRNSTSPFDVLSSDEIKQVVTETIQAVFMKLAEEMDRVLEEQRLRHAALLAKIAGQ